MLTGLFNWLDQHPDAYWAIAAVPTTALLATLVAGLGRNADAGKSRRGEWWFGLVALAVLIAWRWPFLLKAHELDQDENQFLAGAITLTHDPVFWRSVDGTTSGPLNFYVLLILRVLRLPLDFFGARLIGLGLVAVALLACYRLFRSFAATTPARLALLPALIFFATTTDYEFVHYTSEHVSLALFALAAFWWLRRPPRAGGDFAAVIAGGFFAGLLPWAKIQTAPLVAALVVGKLWMVFSDPLTPWRSRWRRGGVVVAAVAAPSLLAAGALVATGQFGNFLLGYIVQNLAYVTGGSSLGKVVGEFAAVVQRTQSIPVFFGVSVGVTLGAGLLFLKFRQRPRFFFVAGAIYSVAAFVGILTPRRSFEHYLLLSVIPLALWSGAGLCEVWPAVRARRAVGLVLLALGMFGPLGVRLRQPRPELLGHIAENRLKPYSTPGAILRMYAEPGDSLGVWGWQAELFVDSGLPQATRDPHIYWLIADSPNREYYRARYLADLQRSRPAFFVDAVGPGSFNFFDRKTVAHESFPALAEYIGRNYHLLVDLGVERIYLRSDLPAVPREQRPGPKPPRTIVEVDAPKPESIVPSTLGGWDLNGRGVQMLLPPGRMTWVLDGTERQVILEYGFYPPAYTEGKSNGADVIVELQTAGDPPRLIFRRRLDPARQPADRGTLLTRATLPPFAPGTRMVIRTDPGDYGDTAWDWVYVAATKFARARQFLPEQFPGFERVPDSADASRADFREQGRARLLVLNTPCALTYKLRGNERHLRFAYGFQPHPDVAMGAIGATYRVELHHANEPVRVLFRRRLTPLLSAGDHGRQQADVAVPEAKENDRLVLRIEGDGAASGQGAYITDLMLD